MKDEIAAETASELTMKRTPEEQTRAQVFDVARAIPVGRVLAYGEVGARCSPPISGYICGRIMNNAADDVPWWRVVAKDGSLPIAKRNPTLAQRQRDLLTGEGVEFDKNGCVKMDEFRAGENHD